eukprot:TRINITY_DN43276_c0_g1_i1.p1 TRINITY_DN43276_c0_g1~~TRINITY_DN43276_c0_g1_i1.p1  ORF type:complete len:845 (+),score=182.46 TRINITY_DN43276_c0_g1_i1:43-2577(+)
MDRDRATSGGSSCGGESARSLKVCLDDSHAVVCFPPLKTFIPADYKEARVYHDECNQELIVVHGSIIQICPIFRRTRELNSLNQDSHCHEVGKRGTTIRGAKRSLEKSWLAVLKTEKTIMFYDLSAAKSRPFASYDCRQSIQLVRSMPGGHKRNNVVKDFFWLSDNCIFIVTTTAMEIFRVVAGRESLQRLRHNATTTDYYAWNSKLRTFLCVNYDKPAWIKPFKIGQSIGIHKYQKVKMDDSVAREHPQDMCRQWTSFAGETMPLYHIRIARIYGQPVLLHVTCRQEIVVYALRASEGRWDRVSSLNLYQSAPVSINIVDNLILVHNHVNRITQIYDYKQQESPIAPPISLGYGFPPFSPARSTAGDIAKSPLLAVSPVEPPPVMVPPEQFYNMDDIVVIHPDKMLDLRSGRLHALALNLQSVAMTIADRRKRLELLLRRWRSKREVMKCLKALLLKGAAPTHAGPAQPLPLGGPQGAAGVFDLLNAALARGVKEQQMESMRMSRMAMSRDSSSDLCREDSCLRESHTSDAADPALPASGSPRAAGSLPPGSDVSASPMTPGIRGDGGDSDPPTARTADSPRRPSTFVTASGEQPRDDIGSVVDCFDPQAVPAWMRPASLAAPEYPYYGRIEASGEWYTRAEHCLVVEQSDVLQVFRELLSEGTLPAGHVHGLCVEYVRSLSQFAVRLEESMQSFLVDLLLVYSHPPNVSRLAHYLQFHVVEDSVETADRLLTLQDRYPQTFQMALDMLSRLRAHKAIVERLLERGSYLRAAEIMIHHQVADVDIKALLDGAAVVLEDDPLGMHALHVLIKRYSRERFAQLRDHDRSTLFEERYARLLGVSAT